MHQSRHRAQNSDRQHSFSSPIQIRHKGRNACSACKKAHIRCDYDEGRQSCTKCSSRKMSCSRPSGTLRPAVEASASLISRPTESTSMHRTQPEATGDVQHVSQDILAGPPYGITRYDNVQPPLFQDPVDVGYDHLGPWYPPTYPMLEASQVVNPEDMSYGTALHDEPPPGPLATAIPWCVNPGDDYQRQTGYAQHSIGLSASQTDFPFPPATHLYSAPPLHSPPQDGTFPYSADSDGDDHAYSMHFPPT
ncbi:hypothetical protein EDD17DRAFT_1557917 [Pisolithus thermaeus]|nr:hypothetical protein EDD17DRAFT_1557917 [Pisolithus thermaeus]